MGTLLRCFKENYPIRKRIIRKEVLEKMQGKKVTWKYTDEELWTRSVFDSEEEAIAEARQMNEGDAIFLGDVVDFCVSVDLSSIFEQIESDVLNEFEDLAEGWYPSERKGHEESFDELEKTISALINAYLKKENLAPSFYTVENIRAISLQETSRNPRCL